MTLDHFFAVFNALLSLTGGWMLFNAQNAPEAIAGCVALNGYAVLAIKCAVSEER